MIIDINVQSVLDEDVLALKPLKCIIGASLSEPHTNQRKSPYLCMYVCLHVAIRQACAR